MPVIGSSNHCMSSTATTREPPSRNTRRTLTTDADTTPGSTGSGPSSSNNSTTASARRCGAGSTASTSGAASPMRSRSPANATPASTSAGRGRSPACRSIAPRQSRRTTQASCPYPPRPIARDQPDRAPRGRETCVSQRFPRHGRAVPASHAPRPPRLAARRPPRPPCPMPAPSKHLPPNRPTSASTPKRPSASAPMFAGQKSQDCNGRSERPVAHSIRNFHPPASVARHRQPPTAVHLARTPTGLRFLLSPTHCVGEARRHVDVRGECVDIADQRSRGTSSARRALEPRIRAAGRVEEVPNRRARITRARCPIRASSNTGKSGGRRVIEARLHGCPASHARDREHSVQTVSERVSAERRVGARPAGPCERRRAIRRGARKPLRTRTEHSWKASSNLGDNPGRPHPRTPGIRASSGLRPDVRPSGFADVDWTWGDAGRAWCAAPYVDTGSELPLTSARVLTNR